MVGNLKKSRKGLIGLGFLIFLAACSSKPPQNGEDQVLEPLSEEAHPAAEEEVEPPPQTSLVKETPGTQAYDRLTEVLSGLSIEGVGLQFESADTLDLLYR